tara:strand:- start:66 stop:554 length:489 start_codon:yes stop_codon:yes gene_type:complete
MSYKAYIYRLRTNEDIDDLKQYLSKMEWVMEDGDIYSPAIFEWFYEVKKTIPIKAYRSRKVIFDYQPTDLVAALTVDRGHLYTSLIEEGELEFSSDNQPRFNRLDEEELPLERPEPGYIRVKNMCISDISEPPNKKPLRGYLDWKKNVLWDAAKHRLKELQS